VVDDLVAAEVRAVRERAGIMDITAFTKVLVEGPDAYALLDRLTPTGCRRRWAPSR
jgi:dimethylglycine dehydrogenase